MKHEILDICVDYAKAGLSGTASPKLYTYVRDASGEMKGHDKRPAVVICPGGGYSMTSDREAEPIALAFLEKGFQCFVLRYSVKQVEFPGALLELATAVALVRSRAEEWNVDPEKIVVCGFSAGGHLAASLGTLWNRDFVTEPLGFHHEEHRPNGMILGYAVIGAGETANDTCFACCRNLLGSRYDAMLETVTLENQVGDHTPPAFIWHTVEDPVVPVEQSLVMAQALQKAGISYEMHIFPRGGHGLSLCTDEVNTPMPAGQAWPEWAARWLRDL